MFERSWVRIPTPYTRWTFFTLICCKNCIVCLKRPKIYKKRTELARFFKKTISILRKQKQSKSRHRLIATHQLLWHIHTECNTWKFGNFLSLYWRRPTVESAYPCVKSEWALTRCGQTINIVSRVVGVAQWAERLLPAPKITSPILGSW